MKQRSTLFFSRGPNWTNWVKSESKFKKIPAALALTFAASLLTGCFTTPPELGVQNGTLKPCPSTPNCVTSMGTDSESMPALTFNGSIVAARVKLIDIISDMPRTSIIEQNHNYVHAAFSSKLFGFVDDVEFLLSSTPDNKTIIDFRSASRLGYSDLGVNKERMNAITAQFENAKPE